MSIGPEAPCSVKFDVSNTFWWRMLDTPRFHGNELLVLPAVVAAPGGHTKVCCAVAAARSRRRS
jgi:hypothetical protein